VDDGVNGLRGRMEVVKVGDVTEEYLVK